MNAYLLEDLAIYINICDNTAEMFELNAKIMVAELRGRSEIFDFGIIFQS